MSANRQRIALLFGGRSAEHEISLRSARNIYQALDPKKYEVLLIGINRSGRWFLLPEKDFLDPGLNALTDQGVPLTLVPGAPSEALIDRESGKALPAIDVVFPIVHGPYGEDGTLQGLLRHLGLPFVGPDVTASAVAMDKDMAKRLMAQADLQVAPWLCFHYYQRSGIDVMQVINQLGLPLYIKPSNMGSSIGVSRVSHPRELEAALEEAFAYDHKVIVETAVTGRELECAVLGNAQLGSTHVGEVQMREGFYDYESKYLSDDAARIVIPAPDIDDQLLAKLQLVARDAYRCLDCEGMARVDMFLDAEGRVFVNEVNTLPGFTSISMYPKLWEQAGLPYEELLQSLIELGLERGRREAALKKSR